MTALIGFIFGCMFFGLAAESKTNPFGKFVRFFVFPFYKIFMCAWPELLTQRTRHCLCSIIPITVTHGVRPMPCICDDRWMVDVKEQADVQPKWDISTGEALCFYLVEAYKTKYPPPSPLPSRRSHSHSPAPTTHHCVSSTSVLPTRRCGVRARRAVHVKRIATFVFYLIMVPTIMSWMPSKDQGGRELFDKGTFISGQISTLLLLTISIFTALRAPKFQVCTHGHALTPSLSRARRQAVLRLYITVA